MPTSVYRIQRTTLTNLRLTMSVVACAAMTLFALPSQADDPVRPEDVAKQATKRLLQTTWSGKLSARRESDKIYQTAALNGAFDANLVAAMTLVRIRQHRYREAIESANQWVRIRPTSLNALRARGWLSTLARDYEAALVHLEAYAAAIPSAPETQRAEHVTFLGRVFGYLESAGLVGVNMDEIRESANRAERALGPAATAFLESRRDAVRKHIVLVARKDATVAATEAAASADRDRKLRDIEARRATLTARDMELRNDQVRLQEELKKRFAEVRARLKPLNDSLSKVDADGRAINYELSHIVSEIAYLESLLIYVRDPILRDRYYRDILRLDRLAAQYEGDAYRLERQADSLNSDRSQVASQGAAERNRVDRELNQKGRELEQIRSAQRRTEIDERKARRPDRAASRQNRVYGAQIGSLTTYAPFPLERERARLLELVK